MPNYEVKMGFGLHLGWAIEGAIGSIYKVDASYLSPHVNVASALEGSTKIYGVPLLVSGKLYEYLSPDIQNFCRLIDVVFIKGNSEPLKLYTSDCSFSAFLPAKLKPRTKKFFRTKRLALKKKLEKENVSTLEIFSESNEIILMRKEFTAEFYSCFDIGVQNYISGQWEISKYHLEKAIQLRSNDGPSRSLLNYMSESNFQAPNTWKNSRYLG